METTYQETTNIIGTASVVDDAVPSKANDNLLLLISGIVGILLNLWVISAILHVASQLYSNNGIALNNPIMLVRIVYLLPLCFFLYVSIIAVLHRKKVEKVSLIKKLAIVNTAILILYPFLRIYVDKAVGFGEHSSINFDVIIFIIISLLYIFGANRNLKVYKV